METLEINGQVHRAPTSWNDLALADQLKAYNILHSRLGDGLQPAEVLPAKRILLLYTLLKLDDAFIREWKRERITEHGDAGLDIFHAELQAMLPYSDALFERKEEEGSTVYQVRLGLTKCPWPSLQYTSKRSKKKHYYAPADELGNMTLYEMALTFALFEQYLETNNIAIADELLATIYRPSKPKTEHNRRSGYEGDRRLPLYKHEAMVKKRIPRFAVLPVETKKLMLFWFASCRQAIVERFADIFTAPKGLQLQGERQGNDYGWGGMLLALSGGIVHLEQVSQQPYEDGLVYLSYLETQRKEVEQRAAFAKAAP